uniref:Transmembrane protein n=1 Tax=Heterorhabditis bacteriophora TaxID=37862 RepID=A0A1I7XIT4_HETBA
MVVSLIPGSPDLPKPDRAIVRLSGMATVNTLKRYLAHSMWDNISRYCELDLFCNDELMGRDFSMRFIHLTRCFLLSAITAFYGFFALLPFQLFSIEVWRVVTSAFVGKNVFILVWTIWSLQFGTILVQQANSNDALLKLYALTQILTTVLICVLGFILYAAFGYTVLLYGANVVDMVPINCAVLVLIKQVVVLQCIISVQLSWTYLRFFNPNENTTILGDDSEHFTWARSLSIGYIIVLQIPLKYQFLLLFMLEFFSSLFPYRMQPLCTILGRISLRSLNKLGICKRQARNMDLNSLQSVAISVPALESANKDAERRRQKALRDLNERLIRAKKIGTMEWEDDQNDDSLNDSHESTPVIVSAVSPLQNSESIV